MFLIFEKYTSNNKVQGNNSLVYVDETVKIQVKVQMYRPYVSLDPPRFPWKACRQVLLSWNVK